MIDLFEQTHSIRLIYQAQRGFLFFLPVNQGRLPAGLILGTGTPSKVNSVFCFHLGSNR
jgi:hypothetical protein